MIIADAVFNRLKSTNIRECVRIARLTRGKDDPSGLNDIIEVFAKYSGTISDTIWGGRIPEMTFTSLITLFGNSF